MPLITNVNVVLMHILKYFLKYQTALENGSCFPLSFRGIIFLNVQLKMSVTYFLENHRKSIFWKSQAIALIFCSNCKTKSLPEV